MGPRPKARKNQDRRLTSTPSAQLQWGRARRRGRTGHAPRPGSRRTRFNGAAPEGAEELAQLPTCGRSPSLQWGRARRRGRTLQSPQYDSRAVVASMGPRPKARKNDADGQRVLNIIVASMGPRPKARKNGNHRALTSPTQGLQWGRARRRGRTRTCTKRSASNSMLQWGRARRRGRTYSWPKTGER